MWEGNGMKILIKINGVGSWVSRKMRSWFFWLKYLEYCIVWKLVNKMRCIMYYCLLESEDWLL